MRLYLIVLLCLFGFQSNAHEMTPTYPVLDSSYIEGVVVAKMKLFNRREDVEYYEIVPSRKFRKEVIRLCCERH